MLIIIFRILIYFSEIKVVLWDPEVKAMCSQAKSKQPNLIESLAVLSACFTQLNCDQKLGQWKLQCILMVCLHWPRQKQIKKWVA